MNRAALDQLAVKLAALRPGTPEYDAVMRALDEIETEQDRQAYADLMARVRREQAAR